MTCDAREQLARLIARGADRADAEARIATQSAIVPRLTPAATRVIDTSGPVQAARARVESAWRQALADPSG